nr:hypothetical protein [Tanacetum cinerariifolium]
MIHDMEIVALEDPRNIRRSQDSTEQWKRCCFHKFTTSSCYGKDVAEMLSLDDMLRIKVREAGSDKEIFTSVAWIRAFNINEPIYAELYHEFYCTYKFDEVCAGGLSRSHASTIRNPILRVIHKMITYGLCQRTTGYDKIQKNDLWLL